MVVACVAAVVAIAPGAGSEAPMQRSAPEPLRVALFGDSLASESAEHFIAAVEERPGAEVRERTMGGTAICDWLGQLRDDVAQWQPDVVVLEFSGNTSTACVQGIEPWSPAHYEKYEQDMHAVMAAVPAATPVYWIGAPAPRWTTTRQDVFWPELNLLYRDLGRRYPNARYVDAGAAVLRDGAYTDVLPCLPDEPCDGQPDPVTGVPSNPVRAADGIHLCPLPDEWDDGFRCAVWASGAYRFGRAMAEGVLADLDR
jgi:hypothetical protein